jgi:hypothetical protein
MGRFVDLAFTLAKVSLKAPTGFRAKFFVCANYSTFQLTVLRLIFGRRARFVDERRFPRAGMTGAYNYGYRAAVEAEVEWVALWADDLLPESSDWLDRLFPMLSDSKFRFGIFSSDEGNHHRKFGWNVFAGSPCAHFYVARVDALPGHLLNQKLRAYVSDNEIAISRLKAGEPIDLLPVKVVHQPTQNPTRTANTPNYAADLGRFYELHPELNGKLDDIVLRGNISGPESRFVPDEGKVVRFGVGARLLGIDEFKRAVSDFTPSDDLVRLGRYRKVWNEEFPAHRARAKIFGQRVARKLAKILHLRKMEQ